MTTERTPAELLTPDELTAILDEPRLTSAEGVKMSFRGVPEVKRLADHIEALATQLAEEQAKVAALVGALSEERLVSILTDAGVEVDYNWCTCGHHGSRHDLNNTCLDCGDRFGSVGREGARQIAARRLRVLLLPDRDLSAAAKAHDAAEQAKGAEAERVRLREGEGLLAERMLSVERIAAALVETDEDAQEMLDDGESLGESFYEAARPRAVALRAALLGLRERIAMPEQPEVTE
jgi:hypothetical protein